MNEAIVENLLTPLWRGLSAEYKSKYRRTIWEQFTNAILSASYTSSLALFYENMGKRLDITIKTEDRKRVTAFLQRADGRAILTHIRTHAQLLVLMVQVENEERKADWEKRQTEEPF